MKKYDQYKDSGIEWIGDIPKHWEIINLKTCYNFEKGKNASKYTATYIQDNEGTYPVYSGQTENEGIMGYINSFDYEVKDAIFTTTVGAKAMTPNLLNGKINLSQNCLIMIEKKEYVNNRFCYYLINRLFEVKRSEIPTHMQPSLRISDLNKFKILLPPKNEQEKIAEYLDQKTSQIDTIIQKKKELIQQLQDYRQSLITETVTKGLHPNIEMKDSGIEWIGDIPKHWIVTKVKRYCKKITDGSHYSPNTTEEGYPYITVKDVKNQKIDLINCNKISKKDYLDLKRMGCQPQKGDVLLSKDGTIGRGAVAKGEECAVLSSLAIFRPNFKLIISEYLLYWLESNININQMNSYIAGAALKRLTLTTINEIIGVFPPINEQKEIVSFLNKNINAVNEVIFKNETQIKKIEEYRQSLISEVVTGKIKVDVEEK